MPIAIGLGVLIAAVVIIGLAFTTKVWADATLRASAGGQAGGLTGILTLPARLIARAVLPGVNFIAHKTSQAAVHYMGPLARWFHSLSAWWLALFAPFGLFAAAATYAIERLTHVVLPREIGRKTRPIDRRAKRAGKIAVGAALSGAALRKAINQWRHHHVEPTLRNLLHRTTVALPRAIGRIGARERALADTVAHPTRAWIRRIGRRAWIVVGAGLMVKFLAKKFPWLFCRKVTNVGKRVCGLDASLLDALLLDTLVIAGGISVVQMARDMQEIEDALVSIMRAGIREL